MAKPQKTFKIGNTIFRWMTVVNMGVKEAVMVPLKTLAVPASITPPVVIEGPEGNPGKDGSNGIDGKEIQLQLQDGMIQWRHTDGPWQPLITMDNLMGPAGKDGKDGLSGANGKDGASGQNGSAGTNGKDGVDGKPGAAGKDGSPGTNGTNGKDGAVGKDGTNGLNGTGFVFMGSITLAQNAVVAIALGIREITVPLTGAVAGKRYICFARSYKLNGGASVSGRPIGYTILDCACNAAGQITVSVNAPLLAVGSSFALTCDVMEAA